MPGNMESTNGKIDFSLTVVGATGLPPSDDNHPKGYYFFYVVVEVDGKRGRTAEISPSDQSTIEWDSCFSLRADKASCIVLRLYRCWKSVLACFSGWNTTSQKGPRFSDDLREGKLIWKSRASPEKLLGSGGEFTSASLITVAVM
ncbi:hypothetical protein BV22DRAFT_754165 [Leucogyrophana mollusca]|uniref:Uncharacterized protein n=1 Tax=Leucogyrophana mollusca TaxID=85980 RepID=A0ACB8B631_9AGAM|nr:hypothetical protein BV22DRAFT_754165 [Leucogyrophana mollusca]